MKKPCRISIGLPVFNAAEFIRAAIEAHLAQTCGDFELIISDNASTDATPDICAEYARKDNRIRFVRQRVNCGVNLNHIKVFRLATGEFFRWAAADDIPSADLLAHALTVLEQDPSVVAYVPDTVNIDETGSIGQPLARNLDLRDMNPVERARAVLERSGQMVFPQGLMRRALLLKTGCRWTYFGWDRILLFELALYGNICHVEGPLFYRRLHPASANHLTRNVAQVKKWVDPTVPRFLLPHWRWTSERMRAVLRSRNLSRQQRFALMRLVMLYARWERVALVRDIGMAAKLLLRRTGEYPF